jgi:membrane protease YdiL (CAAX protease family)
VSERWALALLIGVLAAADVARSTVVPDGAHFAFNVVLAALAIGVALAAGLRADDLGCSRARLGAGLRLGGLAFVAISAVVVVGAIAGLLEDDRTDVSAAEMVLRVVVIIPIGTVLTEELAFRGALDGLLVRVTSPGRATAIGSVLFGLWHLPPMIGDWSWAEALGTLAATTAAGVGFTWLRRRSGSVVAPMLAHLATNSTTFALSWAAGR